MIQKNVLAERIKGMFYGIAIGDALGMPYEKLTAVEIKRMTGGQIDNYAEPNPKHFLKEIFRAGDITDDTQLSLVVADSLIACGGFDIKDQARRHIEAMEKTTAGWGKGTIAAIKRIQQGTDPFSSGNSGAAGNGVAMKVSPFGAMIAIKKNNSPDEVSCFAFLNDIFGLALMTHFSSIAVASGWIQARAVSYCLLNFRNDSFQNDFIKQAIVSAIEAEGISRNIGKSPDRLRKRMIELISNENLPALTACYNINPFYVYNSLPLAYACFLKRPASIEALYDAVRVGGDTDTNASIVGALLGALNGPGIFPARLLEGLRDQTTIEDVSDRFSKRFVKD